MSTTCCKSAQKHLPTVSTVIHPIIVHATSACEMYEEPLITYFEVLQLNRTDLALLFGGIQCWLHSAVGSVIALIAVVCQYIDPNCLGAAYSTLLDENILLLLRSQLYLWGSPFWVRYLCMWRFYNPTIEVVTFCLHGWCMLGVFLLLAFAPLGHECQDFLALVMECMCTQTRLQFVLASEIVWGAWNQNPC